MSAAAGRDRLTVRSASGIALAFLGIGVLSGFAVGIGVAAALVAYALVWLIAVITNLAYYQRFSSHLVSPAGNQLGGWAVLVPMIGGLVIAKLAVAIDGYREARELITAPRG